MGATSKTLLGSQSFGNVWFGGFTWFEALCFAVSLASFSQVHFRVTVTLTTNLAQQMWQVNIRSHLIRSSQIRTDPLMLGLWARVFRREGYL